MEIAIASENIRMPKVGLYFYFPLELMFHSCFFQLSFKQHFKGHDKLVLFFSCQINITQLFFTQETNVQIFFKILPCSCLMGQFTLGSVLQWPGDSSGPLSACFWVGMRAYACEGTCWDESEDTKLSQSGHITQSVRPLHVTHILRRKMSSHGTCFESSPIEP